MTIGLLLLLLVGLGAIAFLVNRAPFIATEFKPIIVFVLLVIAVIAVLQFAGVWGALMNWSPGRRG